MLQQNNPNLDMQEVAQKAQYLTEHRRREVPLFAPGDPASGVPGDLARMDDPEASLPPGDETAPEGRFQRWLWTEWRRFRQPGLTAKQRIRVLPVLGAFFGWVYSLLMINRVRADIAAQLDALRLSGQHTNAHASHLALRMDAIEQRMDGLELRFQHEAERMESASIAVAYMSERQLSHIASQEAVLARLQNDAAMHIERDGRVAALQQSIRRMEQRVAALSALGPEPVSIPGQVAAPVSPAASGPDMGSFYIEFENRFRGSREEIKLRLSSAYQSYLTPYIGDPTARAVDVGAGRGEWLELMRDNGISAIGIDLDRDMVEACREAGFEARQEDAVQYLVRQPEGSIAVISGFHIIEHLPFEVLVGLFDAALHALRPDGMIIFETPNPENIVVGACNFYYDPTHLNPVVPHVAEFMARQRGFARAEILRLHAYPKDMQVVENSELARRFNQLVYGPQDFAVLGWKTSPTA